MRCLAKNRNMDRWGLAKENPGVGGGVPFINFR